MRAIEILASLSPKPVLGAGYVLTKENDDPRAIEILARRLASMGCDYLHLRPVVDHPELLSSRDLSPLSAASIPGISVNLAALSENEASGNHGLPCLSHSLSSVVTSDGRVWLCGRLNADPSAGAMGSLMTSDFRAIWAGEERRRQAALAADGAFCRKSCPRCRMSKYNRLLGSLSRLRTRDFI